MLHRSDPSFSAYPPELQSIIDDYANLRTDGPEMIKKYKREWFPIIIQSLNGAEFARNFFLSKARGRRYWSEGFHPFEEIYKEGVLHYEAKESHTSCDESVCEFCFEERARHPSFFYFRRQQWKRECVKGSFTNTDNFILIQGRLPLQSTPVLLSPASH
jgi:hypothetical protein